MTSPNDFNVTIDVRPLIPRERHPLIFSTFDALGAGEALLLVNDHDPKPLFYQFQAESKVKFTWDYLEAGPEVWQVRIGKQIAQESAAPAGGCVCSH